MTESILTDVDVGDSLGLDQYLAAVTVKNRLITPSGPVLYVTSSGGTTYRLRAVDDDDDRLLLEKPDGDGSWTRHCRVDARIQ